MINDKSLGDQRRRLLNNLPLTVCTLRYNDPDYDFHGEAKPFTTYEIYLPCNSTVQMMRASKKGQNQFTWQRVIMPAVLNSYRCSCKELMQVAKTQVSHSSMLRCLHCARMHQICSNCQSVFSLNKGEHCCRYCGAEVGYRCISCDSFILIAHPSTEHCVNGWFKCSFCGFCCVKCEVQSEHAQRAYGERNDL